MPDRSIEQLLHRFGAAVYHTAKGICRDSQQAQDVVQTVFLKLVQDSEKQKKLRGMERPENYLKAMARTTALDLVRTDRRHRDALRRSAGGRARPEDGLFVHADEGETEARLGALVRRLPEGQRQAVILRYWRGKSYAEAAAQLGISVDALSARLQRGFERLRRELQGSAKCPGDEHEELR